MSAVSCLTVTVRCASGTKIARSAVAGIASPAVKMVRTDGCRITINYVICRIIQGD